MCGFASFCFVLFCFPAFNRHSYTNLKIVNWSKVNITEPAVKKYIDRKEGIEYVMKNGTANEKGRGGKKTPNTTNPQNNGRCKVIRER